MVHAEAILLEAEFLADLENAIVVASAVDKSQNSDCPHCSYTANALSFLGYLREYSGLKIRISQLRRLEGNYDDWVPMSMVRSGVWKEVDGSHHSLIELRDRSATIRESLRQIWPCEECILRFNPTYKSRFCGRKLRTGDEQWQRQWW